MTNDTTPSPDTATSGPLALSSLAVVDATGADALTFLQGQLTNDLIGAGASRACLAGYCNPKGRLLALPLVLSLPDGGLRLIVARELLEGMLQRLRMFVMRAAVTFEERDDLRCLGLQLSASAMAEPAPLAARLPGCPLEPPAERLEVLGGEAGSDVLHVCRWHDAHLPARHARFLIVAAAGGAAEGAAGAADEGDAAWRLGDITAGLPRVVLATREAFVPQMLNLQLVDGLSFRKGCYPGQEIVARMQYLGKLKRHMRRFHAALPAGETGGRIGPGTSLAAGDDADAGQVVDAVRTPEGVELLAVVRIAADVATLRAGAVALEARALPYALPDAAAGPAPPDEPARDEPARDEPARDEPARDEPARDGGRAASAGRDGA